MKFNARWLLLIVTFSCIFCSCTAPDGNLQHPVDASSTIENILTATTTATEITASTPTAPAPPLTPPTNWESDPYVNVTRAQFYQSYTPAVCAMDAYYRTKHFLMSGSIADQPQEPTLAAKQPSELGVLLRNSTALYSEDGKAYFVVNEDGEVVNTIYREGAYVTLEEVAAYVFAFGTVPPNYSNSKKTDPDDSPWGKYLRLNHSYFSGSTSRYPYEPELPDIQGCGGDLAYYEIDIGTTGTDCSPSHPVRVYNDGSRITRGAARIVYTRYDANGDEIIDINEKYLFYTYNHYNDFQEYLNYEGGWGRMFGNITGGGILSSKTDYAPTPYIAVKLHAFVEQPTPLNVTHCYILVTAVLPPLGKVA